MTAAENAAVATDQTAGEFYLIYYLLVYPLTIDVTLCMLETLLKQATWIAIPTLYKQFIELNL